MGSSQQIIVGILLLISAFVVGRYVHNKPIKLGETDFFTSQLQQETNKTPDAPDSVFVRKSQSPFAASSTSNTTNGNSLQQSLRQRILGSRGLAPQGDSQVPGSNNQISQSAFKPAIGNQNLTAPKLLTHTPAHTGNTIVEPDFSHLESQALPEFLRMEVGDREIASAPIDRTPEPQYEMRPPLETAQMRPTPWRTAPSPDSSRYERPQYRSPRLEWSPGTTLRPEPAESISIRTPRRTMPLLPRTIPPARHSTDQPTMQTAKTSRQTSRLADLQPKLKANAELSNVLARDQHLPIEAADFLDYTCKRGDTLHGISKKYYGVSNYYLDIYIHNRDVMRSPSDVRPGQQLRIPVYSE